MVRKAMIPVIALAAALATIGVDNAALSATSLVVPQGVAFSYLGHSCGGIQEQAFATGFDATSGFPTGDVYLQTRCGGSGKGGGYHTTTYSAWVDAMWDFTGVLVSSARLSSAPMVDPMFSQFDGHGNQVYNQSNSAFLVLADGFVPVPRVTGVSVTSGSAAGNTNLTIIGTGFTNATHVGFGGAEAASFMVNTDSSIAAVSPAGAGTVDITVTSAGGTSATSAADLFTFIAAAAVSHISPDNGPINGGTLVTITGTGLSNAIGVYFGEDPAGFTVNDDTSLTAVSPGAEAPDTAEVTVVTLGGTSATSAADVFTYTPSMPTSYCGDGMVDPGEQCDDGANNGQPGDCCSATCTAQPDGTACTDDGNLCTADLCGAGACTHPPAPSFTCTPPDVATGASLLMRTSSLGGNLAKFKWGQGPVVQLSDFGDPTGSEQLELCVYDEIAPDTYALVLSGSPSASSGGVWSESLIGWRFRSATGAPDGIRRVWLKAATVPLQGKVQVRAINSPSFGPLPLQSNPRVLAQFRSSSGTCWGATFSTPAVNTMSGFRATSD